MQPKFAAYVNIVPSGVYLGVIGIPKSHFSLLKPMSSVF
uniref:Uncharacterized protein n=1 Tax=Arundo donax TaxID=35708 RepID=A0A0A8Y8S6_ARUDO